MADRSNALALVLTIATLLAVVIGVRGLFSARRSVSAARGGFSGSVALGAAVLCVILLAGFVLQRQQLADTEALRLKAYAEAMRRQAETVAFSLATAKVLKASGRYGGSLEPVFDRDKAAALQLLQRGIPADSARILWVQERGGNPTLLERFSIGALGVTIDTVWTNEDAVAAAAAPKARYRLVVTDQIRTALDTAGYALMAQLRTRGVKTPVVIYSPHGNAARLAASKERGAVETADPGELFNLVVARVMP
jgi:hypothetical protein